VVDPCREVPILKVIRLYRELLGRRMRARAPVIRVAAEVRAARGIHKTGSKKRSATRLAGAGVKRNSQIDVLCGIDRKWLRKVPDSRVVLKEIPDLVVTDIGPR